MLQKIAWGKLTPFLVMIFPLLLQKTATGLQHRLQRTQTPVIVLLGCQQLPGQTEVFSYILKQSQF